MTNPGENPYDAVPYEGGPYAVSHVRHLQTLATLFGMRPPEISNCRTLELGCASGGNLIPQAVDLPEATFLGVDLSGRQIQEGQNTVQALGIENILLRRANILDVDDDWGRFDYVICHGIFSWVPKDVQDKILEICRRNLVPNGVAFVSYNTYPGWHLVQVVRDLMRYHVTQFDDPGKQISEAKAALEFMAELSDTGKAAGKLLDEELQFLRRRDDGYLFHEHLEPHNYPLYFHEFVSRAESAGLQYLSEVNLASMYLNNYPKRVANMLKSLPLVRQQQYTDFLQGRRFRQTLLCHREVSLNRALKCTQMMDFHVALRSLPAGADAEAGAEADIDVHTDQPCEFKCPDGWMSTRNRTSKAAMAHLREIFPSYVHFDELYRTALSRLGLDGDESRREPASDRAVLAECLMSGYCGNVLRICLNPPRFSTLPGEHPMVGPLPRMEAARGPLVTNQLHAQVNLDDLCRHITRRLDGRHDRKALVESVESALASGEMDLNSSGKWPDKVDPRSLSDSVDEALQRISQAALLIG